MSPDIERLAKRQIAETAMSRLAERAQQHGLKFYAATLTPFEASEGGYSPEYYSPQMSRAREEVNQWIRMSRDIDGFLDFERVLADSA